MGWDEKCSVPPFSIAFAKACDELSPVISWCGSPPTLLNTEIGPWDSIASFASASAFASSSIFSIPGNRRIHSNVLFSLWSRKGCLNKLSETDLFVKHLFKFVLTRCIDLLNDSPFFAGGNIRSGFIFGRGGERADVDEEKRTTGEGFWVKHPGLRSPSSTGARYFNLLWLNKKTSLWNLSPLTAACLFVCIRLIKSCLGWDRNNNIVQQRRKSSKLMIYKMLKSRPKDVLVKLVWMLRLCRPWIRRKKSTDNLKARSAVLDKESHDSKLLVL